VDDIRNVTREGIKRQNKDYMEKLSRNSAGNQSGGSPNGSSGCLTPSGSLGQIEKAPSLGPEGIKSSELKEKMQASATLPGTFYQVRDGMTSGASVRDGMTSGAQSLYLKS